jgi:hypothetical protein
METIKKYEIYQTLIDMAGFYLGNYIADKSMGEPTAKMDKTLIFGISDLLIRNGQVTLFRDKLPEIQSQYIKNNAYIALISFAASVIYDVGFKSSEIKNALKKNAIYNAIGFGSNVIIDKFIVPKDYV